MNGKMKDPNPTDLESLGLWATVIGLIAFFYLLNEDDAKGFLIIFVLMSFLPWVLSLIKIDNKFANFFVKERRHIWFITFILALVFLFQKLDTSPVIMESYEVKLVPPLSLGENTFEHITAREADSLWQTYVVDSIKVKSSRFTYFFSKCSDLNKSSLELNATNYIDIYRYIELRNNCYILHKLSQAKKPNKDHLVKGLQHFEELPIDLLHSTGSRISSIIDSLKLFGDGRFTNLFNQYPNVNPNNGCFLWKMDGQTVRMCEVFRSDVSNDGINDVVVRMDISLKARKHSMVFTITKRDLAAEIETIP